MAGMTLVGFVCERLLHIYDVRNDVLSTVYFLLSTAYYFFFNFA